MIHSFPFCLINAFTGQGALGNQAGVCYMDQFPDASAMQYLAQEIGWSEIAFLTKEDAQQFHIRWFSPKDEAPICGHATLASAHFLWESNIVPEGQPIAFLGRAGVLNVRQERSVEESGWLAMTFPEYPVYVCEEDTEKLKHALGNVPIVSVWRGALVYMVLLSHEEEVRACVPDLEAIKQLDCRAVVLTAPSSDPAYDFVSRYFAPKVGINEDPVCGSAHCRLTPFWSERLGKKILMAHQVSQRGGILKVEHNAAKHCVVISGRATTVFTGTIEKRFLLRGKKT